MCDFEFVLTLARAFAPCEEAVHAREREKPLATPELPRQKAVRAPAAHVPLRAANSRR